ncbi:MAG: C1 family peptidase [Ferruginibacter sp.]
MPIKMTDDPENQNDYNEQDDNSGGGGRGNFPGGGGGGGLLSFLPLLLGLFRGGKKGLVLLAIVGGLAYFLFFRQGGCSGLTGGGEDNPITKLFSQSGYSYNPDEFKKASVYEGLSDDNTKNPLPEAVSLAAFAPQRLNQGEQGSCVAWSSAYAARTVLEAASTRQDPNALKFSPAFLYNYIGLDGCQGSYIQRAMEFMSKNGALPFNDFPYDPTDCSRQANSSLIQKAQNYKIHGFTRLTEGDELSAFNIRAIKEHLAKDAPVVIGMMVGGSFMQEMMGQKIWHPTSMDRQQMGFGGHAMCVIGYDDRLEGGAFQIMNSWGSDWGQNGIAWVRYGDFKEFVREAYGVDPLPKRGAALNIPLEYNIGLVNNETKQYIPISNAGGNLFKTTTPIKKGTRFKMEIKNSTECYIYLFASQTDNSSQVLFPYKPIHSPYCGITGYRLFPRKESMEADAVGERDYMAIVVSTSALDYNAVNASINKSTAATFPAKVNEALGGSAVRTAQFGSAGAGIMSVKANNPGQNGLVVTMVEVDKN